MAYVLHNRPVRKYYRLTAAGITELEAFRAQWAPFVVTVDELMRKDKHE